MGLGGEEGGRRILGGGRGGKMGMGGFWEGGRGEWGRKEWGGWNGDEGMGRKEGMNE